MQGSVLTDVIVIQWFGWKFELKFRGLEIRTLHVVSRINIERLVEVRIYLKLHCVSSKQARLVSVIN